MCWREEATETLEAPWPPLDPLLALDRYAIAWGGGLSSRSWRVLDDADTHIIEAQRRRDAIRSLMMAAMFVVALIGAGGGGIAAAIGGYPALALGIVLAVCMATVFVLAPVVALRRPNPVVLSAVDDGRELLRVERRTRLGVIRVNYDLLAPEGESIGSLSRAPILRPLRTVWRIELPGHPTLFVSGSSAMDRWREWISAGVLTMSGAVLRRAQPVAERQIRFTPVLTVTADGQADPLARAVAESAGSWTWLVFDDDAEWPVSLRPPILAACLLVISGEGD